MTSEVRRRPITNAGDVISDSSSCTSKSTSTFEEDDGRLNRNSEIGAVNKRKANLVDGSSGVLVQNQNQIQNGGNNKRTVHYAYRPSTPAHNRIKESPLSSDAIFKQVFSFYFYMYTFSFNLMYGLFDVILCKLKLTVVNVSERVN